MSIFYNKAENEVRVPVVIGAIIVGIIIFLVALLGYGFLSRSYSRYQARQDALNEIAVQEQGRLQARLNAENQAQINEIQIKQQEQLIQVEKQKAQIRVVDAEGIAQAQAIIAKSLTDAYLQYLAIDAQKAMASGSNHTEIYIPSGLNGIPLVKTLGQ